MTQDELKVLVAELRMDATDGEYPTRDQRAERAADEIERLSAEVARLTAELRAQAEQCHRRGMAMTWGWADRDRGIAADACPHAMDDIERQCWDKGWQWRDDQLALKRAEADRDRHEAAALEQAELRGRAEGEARALIDMPIGAWKGGGYAAMLPWRSACYPGGTWLNNGVCHFDDLATARLAVRAAAGLDGKAGGA